LSLARLPEWRAGPRSKTRRLGEEALQPRAALPGVELRGGLRGFDNVGEHDRDGTAISRAFELGVSRLGPAD